MSDSFICSGVMGSAWPGAWWTVRWSMAWVRSTVRHRLMRFGWLQLLLLILLTVSTGCLSAGGEVVKGLPVQPLGQAERLTAEEITERYREAERKRAVSTEAGVVFAYQRDIRITDYHPDGKVKRLQTRRLRSFTDNRVPVLMLRDGEVPTPEQVEKQHREIQKTMLKVLGNGGKGEGQDDGDARLLLRQIEEYGDQFKPTLIGTETVRDRPAYVLNFTVLPGMKFKEPLVNLVLHHLIIKVWIDKEDFHAARLEAVLANPLFAVGGLAAKLDRFRVVAEQVRLTPEIWADAEIHAEAQGRVLWNPFTVNFESLSTDYQQLER